jgi:plastocyanin
MKRSASLALSILAFGAVSLSAQTRAATPAQAAPASRPAQGNIVRVRMVMQGTKPLFQPAAVTVKQGDIVEFVNVSGGPHNVTFEATKIPAGAATVLNNAMPNRMSPLMGPMMTAANQAYRVSFAGAPVGSYEIYCMPHKAMGMKMVVTVQPSTPRH